MTADQNKEPEVEMVPDEEADTEALAAKLKKLKTDFKACQTERQEYLAGWQRAKADYVNFKKEQDKARVDLARFTKEGLLLELLTLADSFELAFANKEAWEKVDKNWRLGVEYIYSQLVTIFKNNGLEEENPLGQRFNPEQHQAVGTIPVEAAADDHKIMAVVAKGYRLADKIIRPALVKIGEFKKS